MALVYVYNLPNSNLNQEIKSIIFNAILDLNLNPEENGFDCIFPREKERGHDIVLLVEDIVLSENQEKKLTEIFEKAIDELFKMPARCNFAGEFY